MKSLFLLTTGVLMFSNMTAFADCPGGQCGLRNRGYQSAVQSQGGSYQSGNYQGDGGYYQVPPQEGSYQRQDRNYQGQPQGQGRYYQQEGYYQRQEGTEPDQNQIQTPKPERLQGSPRQGVYYQQGGYYQRQQGAELDQDQIQTPKSERGFQGSPRQGAFYQQGGYYQRQEDNVPDQDQIKTPKPESSLKGSPQKGSFYQQSGYYQRQDQNPDTDQEIEEPKQDTKFKQEQSGSMLKTSDTFGTTSSTTQHAQNQNLANSDNQIEKKISDTFKPGYFTKGYEGVKADVRNGNVNLSGTVESDSAKKEVTEKVQKIDGVKSVNNTQLRVQPKK